MDGFPATSEQLAALVRKGVIPDGFICLQEGEVEGDGDGEESVVAQRFRQKYMGLEGEMSR